MSRTLSVVSSMFAASCAVLLALGVALLIPGVALSAEPLFACEGSYSCPSITNSSNCSGETGGCNDTDPCACYIAVNNNNKEYCNCGVCDECWD